MKHLLLLIAISTSIAVGCNNKPAVENVTYFSQDDQRMNEAIAKARSTVNTFIIALKSPKPNQNGFSIKFAFEDGSQVEHMWLSSVTYDGKVFRGRLNNEPEHVKSFKIGQSVTVEASKITDWMYIENRRLVGGYTLRVIRDAMSPEEKAEFDQSIPFIVD